MIIIAIILLICYTNGNNMATENFAAYVVRIMQIIRITEAILPLQKC